MLPRRVTGSTPCWSATVHPTYRPTLPAFQTSPPREFLLNRRSGTPGRHRSGIVLNVFCAEVSGVCPARCRTPWPPRGTNKPVTPAARSVGRCRSSASDGQRGPETHGRRGCLPGLTSTGAVHREMAPPHQPFSRSPVIDVPVLRGGPHFVQPREGRDAPRRSLALNADVAAHLAHVLRALPTHAEAAAAAPSAAGPDEHASP
jgi:hypothetical protein